MKVVFYRIKILNYFVMTFCILTSFYYIITTKNILDIAESMGSGTEAFIMLIKYAVFNRRAEETFGIMDEIMELNEKCKIFLNWQKEKLVIRPRAVGQLRANYVMP